MRRNPAAADATSRPDSATSWSEVTPSGIGTGAGVRSGGCQPSAGVQRRTTRAGAPARVVRRWTPADGWQPPLRTPAPVPIPEGITPEQLRALSELDEESVARLADLDERGVARLAELEPEG